MKSFIKQLCHKFGYDIVKYNPPNTVTMYPPDLSEDEIDIINRVRPFTMTRIERIVALIRAIKYLLKANIPGDIAECGVWRGGSMMAVALTLLQAGENSRQLFLYDTFKGMPAPLPEDKYYDGRSASAMLASIPKDTGIWCYAGIDEVKKNLLSTGYPENNLHFFMGRIEDTIPNRETTSLSLLRIDTDWYESTKHGLYHLYPILNHKGILILDDYGCWQGAKLATDEYFKSQGISVFLNRIDYSGRLIIKS